MLADCNAYNFFLIFEWSIVSSQKAKMQNIRLQCSTMAVNDKREKTRMKFLPSWKFSEVENFNNYIKMDRVMLPHFFSIFCRLRFEANIWRILWSNREINRLFVFSHSFNDDFSNSNNYFTIILLGQATKYLHR